MGSILLGSAAAQGDAIHLFADGLQSGFLALMAFTNHRFERVETDVLGARMQAGFLAVAGILILYGTLRHTATPRNPEIIILLGTFSTFVATLRVKMVHEGWDFISTLKLIARALKQKENIDLIIIAELSHVFLDVVTSVLVVISGVCLYFGSVENVDHIIAYTISMVAFASAALVWSIAKHH